MAQLPTSESMHLSPSSVIMFWIFHSFASSLLEYHMHTHFLLHSKTGPIADRLMGTAVVLIKKGVCLVRCEENVICGIRVVISVSINTSWARQGGHDSRPHKNKKLVWLKQLPIRPTRPAGELEQRSNRKRMVLQELDENDYPAISKG